MGRILLKHVQGESPVEVFLERASDGGGEAYRYRRGGAEGVLQVERAGGGEGWMRIGDSTFQYHSIRRSTHVEIWMNGRRHVFQLVGGAPRRSQESAGSPAGSSDRLTAPMPGTVRKITVAPGAMFNAHQPLIIMESMKMELTLSVPHAGRVKDIVCAEGQLVEMGATLVRLEEIQNSDFKIQK